MLALVSMALGLIFLFAGVAKIADAFGGFAQVAQYQVVTGRGALIVAVILPWLEVMVGLALLLRICARGACAVATILLFAFLLAQVSAMIRGLRIGCACFGPGAVDDVVDVGTVGRTATLAAIAGVGWGVSAVWERSTTKG